MKVTRENYEEFFLLYVDNELSAADRKMVEVFVEQNPDLRAELKLLADATLPAESFSFDKESLFRPDESINTTNYEQWFLLHADKELSNEQQQTVETFVLQNPSLQEPFIALQQTILPVEVIEHPNKEELYREKKKRRVIPLFFKAAAVVTGLLITGAVTWMAIPGRNSEDGSSQVAKNNDAQSSAVVNNKTASVAGDQQDLQAENSQQSATETAGELAVNKSSVDNTIGNKNNWQSAATAQQQQNNTRQVLAKADRNAGNNRASSDMLAAASIKTTATSSTNQLSLQSTNQLSTQSTPQPVNPSTSQPINQSTGEQGTKAVLASNVKPLTVASYTVEKTNYKVIDTEADDAAAMQYTYVAGMPVNKNKMRSVLKGAGRLLTSAFKREEKDNTVTITD